MITSDEKHDNKWTFVGPEERKGDRMKLTNLEEPKPKSSEENLL